MANLIFLFCAFILASTSSAYPAESENQISKVETTTIEVGIEATEFPENIIADEDIKDETIAKIVASVKEAMSKKEATIDILTNKLLRDTQTIKKANREAFEKENNKLRQTSDAIKAKNENVDFTDCDKIITVFENSASVALEKANDCVQSVENAVQDFILNLIEKTSTVFEHLFAIDKSVIACGDDKGCRADLEKEAKEKVTEMLDGVDKDIGSFTVKSVYYHPKLTYCNVLDSLKLFWEPVGKSESEYRICAEKKVKAAH